jgi:hypothetical protein
MYLHALHLLVQIVENKYTTVITLRTQLSFCAWEDVGYNLRPQTILFLTLVVFL